MAIETLASLALSGAAVNIFEASATVARADGETSGVAKPADWLVNAFGGQKSSAGKRVTPDSAMNLAAVWACMTVISESLATLPFQLYRELGEGEKRKDKTHPVYRLLTEAPNDWQTPFEWKEQMTGHVLGRGNAYSHLRMNGDGVITSIVPMMPDRVTVWEDTDGGLWYRYAKEGKNQLMLAQHEVFHLRGKCLHGKLGMSPITAYRNAVGYAQALEDYGAALVRNGAQMGGIIKIPADLSETAKLNLLKWMEDRHKGFDNAFKLGLLDAGMEYQNTSVTPSDAQFLDARRFQTQEICSIFRVPPHMAGDLSRSTNNNIEQQALEFVVHTLGPWMARWEQALRRDLLSSRERVGRVIKVNANALLRADVRSRNDAYSKARQWGWMSVNDIRALEEMDRVDGGDRYLEPANMKPVGQAAAA
jgi:HK97 family phage portal protein